MTTVSGFPNSAAGTVIPNALFSRVLPEISEPAELIVSAYVFFAFATSKHRPRYVTLRELEADAGLARAIGNLCDGAIADALRSGLDLAVERGTLLRASATGEQLFAPNMPANRRALERLAAEGVTLEETLPPAEGEPSSNIYTLYEENIGGITPLIAEDLRDAEQRYPPEWVREAFREAAELNKRSWRYIARILERWEIEGPTYEAAGRHTEADSPAGWLAERYRAGKRSNARADARPSGRT